MGCKILKCACFNIYIHIGTCCEFEMCKLVSPGNDISL